MATKKSGTSLIRWDEELARRAQIAKGTEDSVALGNFLSLRGAQMTYNGNPIEGNKIKVVVLAHVLENKYYKGKFDANTPQSPVCYAFGAKDKDLKPHEQSPEKQSATCDECEHNEWGSARQGRGKACKNSRRLALLHADAMKSPAEIRDAVVVYLEMPVTSVKAWAGYVQSLANVKKRPPSSVVTEISVTPDSKTQLKVGFKLIGDVEDRSLLGALMSRADEIEKQIGFPYPILEDDEGPKSKKGGKATKRSGARAVSRF